jgi:hypothetical protein
MKDDVTIGEDDDGRTLLELLKSSTFDFDLSVTPPIFICSIEF